MSSPLQKSWSSISAKSAETYLDYYPKDNKHVLARWLKERIRKPRVLEVGCGNLVTYGAIQNTIQLQYTGVDFSKPLIDAARKKYGNNPNCALVHQDCFSYLKQYAGPKFDMVIIAHVIELVESQDLLLHFCAKHANHIAILWYEPPIYQFHTVELKPSAHPKDSDNAPYLRIKTGKQFYADLLKKHNLTIMQKTQHPINEKDVLHIIKC